MNLSKSCRQLAVGVALAACMVVVATPAEAKTIEDTSANLAYTGVWRTWISGLCSASTCHANTNPGDAVTMSFTGTYLGVTYVAREDGGIVTVTIDGTVVDTIDTYAAAGVQRTTTYMLVSTTHRVVVAATGTRNASSLNSVLYFDSFKARRAL